MTLLSAGHKRGKFLELTVGWQDAKELHIQADEEQVDVSIAMHQMGLWIPMEVSFLEAKRCTAIVQM